MKRRYKITIGAKTFVVEVEEAAEEPSFGEGPVPTALPDTVKEQMPDEARSETTLIETEGEVVVRAPIRGKIVCIKCRDGDEVNAGDVLLSLEAMKMENDILAPKDGIVRKVLCKEGQEVDQEDPLVAIAPGGSD